MNRAVSEGRKAFVDHYLSRETGDVCADTERRLGRYLDGELRSRDHLRLRAHLTRCPACRARLHAERDADRALRALLPPALTATTGHGWLTEHVLNPLTDLATRLTPAADHALSAKVGLAAASTVALAGGGLTVSHQLATPAPPPSALRASFTATPSGTAAKDSPASALTSATSRQTNAVIDDARAKARATARKRAAAKRRAAARRAAQTTAASQEFAPAATEFTPSAAPATAGGASTNSAAATRAEPPQTAPVEVPADSSTTDTGVTVTDTP